MDRLDKKLMTLDELVADPTASNWLKKAATESVARDAVDAANDAAWLARWLAGRVTQMANGWPVGL